MPTICKCYYVKSPSEIINFSVVSIAFILRPNLFGRASGISIKCIHELSSMNSSEYRYFHATFYFTILCFHIVWYCLPVFTFSLFSVPHFVFCWIFINSILWVLSVPLAIYPRFTNKQSLVLAMARKAIRHEIKSTVEIVLSLSLERFQHSGRM